MRTLKIIILDDMQIRHDGFKAKWPQHELIHCRTIDEFKVEVVKGSNIVCFDHDLNDEAVSLDYGVYGNRELTGSRCCQFHGGLLPKGKTS